jgi:hypothetical protein
MRICLSCLFLFFFLTIYAQEETYSVKKTPFSTEEYDEFSPVYYNGGLVFSSNRASKVIRYSTQQGENFFNIYYIDTSLQNNKYVKPFSNSLTTRFNDGPVTFNKNRDTIFYSRNLVVDGGAKNWTGSRNKLGLFTAVLKGKKWTGIKELRFNSDSYNITTPCLSPDGKKLYFASDRPDGYGGSDLYVCEWTNGYWGNPVNLGPVINTEGNEAYPFVNQAGELFFSSDGHPGLGGRDIYFSKFIDSEWIIPIGLDAPVNSESNDFGFISDEILSEGFFTSDRENSNDIYSFKTNTTQFLYCGEQQENVYCFSFPDDVSIDIDPLSLQFQWDFGDGNTKTGYVVEHCFPGPGKYIVKQNIVDRKTGKPVHTKLSFELDLKDMEQPFIDADMRMVRTGEPVNFNAQKSNLPQKKVLALHWDFGDGGKASGEFVKHAYNESGVYKVKLAILTEDNKSGHLSRECISTEISVDSEISDIIKTDTAGKKPELPVISSNSNALIDTLHSSSKEVAERAIYQVVIQTSKAQLGLNDKLFSSVIPKYNLKEIFLPDEDLYRYVIDEGINFMDIIPAYIDAVSLGFNEALIKTYLPEDSAEQELWNIKRSYGTQSDDLFAGNNLRTPSGGLPVLDQLVIFLKKYPGIILKIDVHTDNTRLPVSNLSLSATQAKRIIEYLVSKGISEKRLIPFGYGSSRPIASNLSEADRKKNRRVDFIIISNEL